ncbi:ABC transporter ATP-binding protein [Enterococcus sp.]|uniref:ABC transporter ATP-binding protein n=1 Tax=Enterococcus sp. TaxID=35783 RepID=UPI0029159176|nr:ABC transporter ATP-binding protein [Enterococcus sp.]MDU5335801.1 ABC transporter ATP-binding protein [Enterococcus sp.]
MERKILIEAKGISKQFKDYQAIKNLDFEVYEGEIFGFLGPSGAGKTTTIKILTGQLKQTSGQASILGIPVENVDEDIYKKIGIVSDMSGFYEKLTVYQNLKFFAKLLDVDLASIDDLLKKFGLYEHRQKPAGKLSRGMKQRLVLIRAILHKPNLLFLDEPTSGLDPVSALSVHQMMEELRAEGTSIFLTTHNMEEADKLCDRVALLNEGVIAELDTPENLRLKFNKQKRFIIQLTDETEVQLQQSVETAKLIEKWIAADRVETIHSCEPTLEKVFLEATGRKLV